MKWIFADSSAVIAYFHDKDEHHREAMASIEKLMVRGTRLLLTDYILDECITGIMSNAGHRDASMAGEFMLSSDVISIVWLDRELKMRAWDYFKKHRDKRYSFTDCTSFVLMKEMKIVCCLSFDTHFKQAGFEGFF